jgi:hypothetical protein
MQLYGDLDIVSFIRINRLRWIGHISRMGNKRMVYQVFATQPQGSRPRGRPNSRWWDCVYGDIRKCKIRNREQRSKNREDWMRSIKEAKAHIGLYSQLRRRRKITLEHEQKNFAGLNFRFFLPFLLLATRCLCW